MNHRSSLRLAVILVSVFTSFFRSPVAWSQRDLKDIPVPNPVEERSAMRLAVGLEVNLYAADPMMFKPIAMNFGPDGRLWIAGSSVYPQLAPGEVANDQIIVLEDSDGDGKADRHRVFVDKLLIPTGVLPDLSGNGVYVAASTQLLHFQDTDGDGVADRKRLVLSGFGTEDTHHMLHTLRWGPDGWLYMNQSIYIHSHVETPFGTQHLDGGGIWRYYPPTGKLEVVCKGFVNPWGHVFDGSGMEFATDGAFGEGINYVFQDSVFVTSPGAERWLSGLNPGSPKHCGLEVLSGRHVPESWQGNMITNDFRAHGVCRFEVQQGEKGYTSRQQPDLIRTGHVAFRPIDCKMGPDGALYVADWYNPIIQHGEVDFRDPRRDRVHGRIWRITWPNRPLETERFQPQRSTRELIEQLEQPLDSLRQWARLELARRPWSEVQPAIKSWCQEAAKTTSAWGVQGLTVAEHRQLEVLRQTVAADAWDEAWVEDLLKHPSAIVRATALMMANWDQGRWQGKMSALQRAVHDSHWQVRQIGVTGLRRVGSLEALEIAMEVLEPKLEPNTDFALWSFVRETEPAWTTALAEGKLARLKNGPATYFANRAARGGSIASDLSHRLETLFPTATDRAAMVEAISEKGDAAACGKLLGYLVSPAILKKPEVEWQHKGEWQELLRSLVDRSVKRGVVPEQAETLLQQAMAGSGFSTETPQIWLHYAAASWRIAGLAKATIQGLKSLPESQRQQAEVATLVGTFGSLDQGTVGGFLEEVLTDSTWPSGVKGSAIRALSKISPSQAARHCVAMLSQLSAKRGMTEEEVKQREATAIGAFLEVAAQPVGAEALVLHLGAVASLPGSQVQQILNANRGQVKGESLNLLLRLGGLNQNRWSWSEAFRDEILQISQMRGNAERGEKLFRQASLQCLRCHPLGSNSGHIGPNLMSLGGSAQPDYILESLIVPEARLKEGFETIQVALEDGTVVSGLLKSRGTDKLVLLLNDGSLREIEKEAIESEKTGGSLMPNGLVDSLSKQQVADLVQFLSQLGRDPAYSLRADGTVRRMEFLQFADDAHPTKTWEAIESNLASPSSGLWQAFVSRVDGTWQGRELPQGRLEDATQVRVGRVEWEAAVAGQVRLAFQGKVPTRMWIDGKAHSLAGAEARFHLEAGVHTLAFAWECQEEDVLGVQFDWSQSIQGKQLEK